MYQSIQIAKHFVDLANVEGISDMSLLKLGQLVYISHGWMLGKHSNPLITEDVEAWKYGPVIPELYKDINQDTDTHIDSLPEGYGVDLTDDEESIVEQVFYEYSSYTDRQLVALTSKEGTPWYRTKQDNIKSYGFFFFKNYTLGKGCIIPEYYIQQYYKELSKERTT